MVSGRIGIVSGLTEMVSGQTGMVSGLTGMVSGPIGIVSGLTGMVSGPIGMRAARRRGEDWKIKKMWKGVLRLSTLLFPSSPSKSSVLFFFFLSLISPISLLIS
jgi:hypothetical protein